MHHPECVGFPTGTLTDNLPQQTLLWKVLFTQHRGGLGSEAFELRSISHWGFLGGSLVENLPVMQKMPRVRSLGWADPLEDDMATHSSVLALENPIDRGGWQAAVHRVTQSHTR